jgi:uncharacterized membrane protein
MAFCASCGTEVSGRFCQKCGAPVAAPGAGPTPPPPAPANPSVPPQAYTPAPTVGMTNNLAGALCYLAWFVTGILFLVLAPYNQDRTVRFHAFQSIFVTIAWVVLWIVITIIGRILYLIPFIGAVFMMLLDACVGIGGLILWIYLMFKTYNNEKVVLPVIGPIAEKQAGI